MIRPSEAFVHNLKFALISLVVTANSIEPLLQRSEGLRTLYMAIFTFHIPLFAFAMGILAKDYGLEDRGVRALTTIAWQYFVFQSLYSLLDVRLFHAPGVIYSFFVPYSLLWFLLSHLCWRLLLIPFRWIKHPLAAAVLLGIAAGYWPGSGVLLSISRTFVFFPFFLAGFLVRLDRALLHRLRFWRLPAAAAAAAWLVILTKYGDQLPLAWLYGNATYAELGANVWTACLVRTGLYLVTAVVSIAFLGFVPWKETMFTKRGQRSGYIFLLHGILLKTLIASGLYLTLTPAKLPLVFVLAALLITLLSAGWVQRRAHPLFEPSFLRPDGQPWVKAADRLRRLH